MAFRSEGRIDDVAETKCGRMDFYRRVRNLSGRRSEIVDQIFENTEDDMQRLTLESITADLATDRHRGEPKMSIH